MNNIKLQAVCRGIKHGNEGDFKTLFHAYFPRLLFYACRFVYKETGEDVVQDVFMHVWENRERLVMGDTFVSFLYESTYNKVLNILKHEQVKTEKHAEMEVRQRALHYFSPYDNPVFERIIHHERYDELSAAIDKLPEKGKLCIRMSYLQGLKTKEIARILQISSRTVETHLYTSLKTLRKMFKEEDKMLLLAACSFFSLVL
ncbi:MAG: RNA polymerase sigma-70 factor [Bacteroidota bacterium]|nr:RNA polymerase sigma-70 factor [Bacteroidota bacterium]